MAFPDGANAVETYLYFTRTYFFPEGSNYSRITMFTSFVF